MRMTTGILIVPFASVVQKSLRRWVVPHGRGAAARRPPAVPAPDIRYSPGRTGRFRTKQAHESMLISSFPTPAIRRAPAVWARPSPAMRWGLVAGPEWWAAGRARRPARQAGKAPPPPAIVWGALAYPPGSAR